MSGTPGHNDAGQYSVTLRVTDQHGAYSDQSFTVTVDPGAAATVVGRHIFYNQSYFDGNGPAANAADDNAIAMDKQAPLPGATATFANYTSYSRGINGIMVDIDGLSDPVGLTAASFELRVGNTDDPSGWAAGPAPASVTVREGAGVNGSDRVTLIWENGAIQRQWLQVTVAADAATGLSNADVFYFGNAVGESGNSGTNTFVDGTDFAGARDNFRNFLNRAPVDFAYDYNRDSFVDGSDMAVARDNNTNFLTALRLLNAPAAQSRSVQSSSQAETTVQFVEAARSAVGESVVTFGLDGSRIRENSDSCGADCQSAMAIAGRLLGERGFVALALRRTANAPQPEVLRLRLLAGERTAPEGQSQREGLAAEVDLVDRGGSEPGFVRHAENGLNRRRGRELTLSIDLSAIDSLLTPLVLAARFGGR